MVPALVLMVQEPVARTANRPTEVPALTEGAVTTARTRSPVRMAATTLVALVALVALSGKSNEFVRHICRLCRPIAAINNGTMPAA
jgi:hypothetical protein